MDFVKTIAQEAARYSLWRPGDTLVLGVSGGPDSVAMAHALQQLAGGQLLTLILAHLHHGLRGEEADADADFVARLAAALGLDLVSERGDVPGLMARSGLSMEEAARQARYHFLTKTAIATQARAVVVAHTADDQVETVLMHFLRGAALAGLRGMRPCTPLAGLRLPREAQAPPIPPDLALIRPLLHLFRTDVVAYCQANGLQPRLDRSNLDTTIYRNHLRHNLIPLLEAINPQFKTVVAHSAEVLGDDYELVNLALQQAWPQVVDAEEAESITFNLLAWRQLPPALGRASLRQAIAYLRRDLRNINWIHIEPAFWALRTPAQATTGTRFTLPAGLELVVSYDTFRIAPAGREPSSGDVPQLPIDAEIGLKVPGETPLGETVWVIRAQVLPRQHLPPDWSRADPWTVDFDVDSVARLTLRARRIGDRFAPLGWQGRATRLSDWMITAKLPREARAGWPLLVARRADGSETIAWVVGYRQAEWTRVTPETQSVLRLACKQRRETTDFTEMMD